MKRALADRAFQPEFFIQIVMVFLVSISMIVLAFDPVAAAVAFLAAMITGYALGIFHHMLLSHRAFHSNGVVEFAGALLGTLSWRGPMAGPVRYAAMHRIHHEASDQENDPHSPVHGRWHAFIGWMWFFSPDFARPEQYEKFVPTLAGKGFLRILDRNVHLIQLVYALSVAGVAYMIAKATGEENPGIVALKYTAYLVFVKTAFVLVLANAVDVINHMGEEIGRGGIWKVFGYRNYETSDRSTNSLLMGIIHLGGAISWHNNHHAHPGYFVVRRKRWEIDVHYRMVWLLSLFGWTSNIKKLDDSVPPPTSTNRHTLRSLHAKSPVKAIFMIVGRVGAFALILALLTALLSAPSWAMVLVAPGLFLAAGIALQNIGLVGHEGTHFNLSASRMRSARIGNAVSALVPFHFNTGFAISHSRHHKYTNLTKDPDIQLFRKSDRVWKRIFLARGMASRSYFKKTLALARGHIIDEDLTALSLSAAQLQRLAVENIFFSAGAILMYVGLISFAGSPVAYALIGSFLAAVLVSGVRPYFEHAGTDDRRSHNARTFDGPLFNLIFGGINYHDAHHRFPGVPAYRARALASYLRHSGDTGELSTYGWRELWEPLRRKEYGSAADLYATMDVLGQSHREASDHDGTSVCNSDHRAQVGV